MTNKVETAAWRAQYPVVDYVVPFAVVLLCMALFPRLGVGPYLEWPLSVLIGIVTCAICWPCELPYFPVRVWGSIAVGAAVFVLWIVPDLLNPQYRSSVFFSNSVLGHVKSSIPAEALRSPWVLAWRTARAVVVVPIAEELFWRGWLMRWFVKTDFQRVALGTYVPFAFWITALLFASEHGPYWDVGLLTGVIYNLWMVRTKSVADCVLMHSVTNGLLSGYVILDGQWQYWQ